MWRSYQGSRFWAAPAEEAWPVRRAADLLPSVAGCTSVDRQQRAECWTMSPQPLPCPLERWILAALQATLETAQAACPLLEQGWWELQETQSRLGALAVVAAGRPGWAERREPASAALPSPVWE